MSETCWFCGAALANPASACGVELWGETARPPEAGGYPVRQVHARYLKIEPTVPSCPACAARRRTMRFGLWMLVVPGFVLGPLVYKLWPGAASGAGQYPALALCSAMGAVAGLLLGWVARRIMLAWTPGPPLSRSVLQHPEIVRLVALGWHPETPFDD
ncbi:MAG: hypothetical protein JO303_12170 [Caulobacteraceae bacterium]|nr:hypothetical protein [Caulobacteraceae bacterium]